MAEAPGITGIRPLGRSLQPLAGESLQGYLLRLAHRLHLAPIRLARLTGCADSATSQLGRRLLLDLDIGQFAQATQLTWSEASALTLATWADRYPPIARSLNKPGQPASRDDWLFNRAPRYCPQCLAGDGSTIQQQYGGPWRKVWHLPIAFACPDHGLFLQQGCPRPHPDRVIAQLISQVADGTLHPAQCRQRHPGEPAGVGGGRSGPSCGTRLDQPWNTTPPSPSPDMLTAQQRLLDLLDPSRPAEDATCQFADLRVVTALLCASWPRGVDLIDPTTSAAVAEHIRGIRAGTRQTLDTPPRDPTATAALLTAAITLLDAPDLQETLARHLQDTWKGRPSRAPWAVLLSRYESSCSESLRQAAEPSTRAFRRTENGTKAPARADGYRPEHIAAFLQESWHQKYLAPLAGGSKVKSARRNAAVLLVQWAAGGSLGNAAAFLGFNDDKGQYAPSPQFQQWLNDHGSARFTAALHDLAHNLGTTTDLIDYHQRRKALRDWSLSPNDWQEIIDRLPPVPGPVQPTLDERKRQEASAFIWARATQGELRFAPRPIEDAQPDEVRRAWLLRRGATWFQLSRPEPMQHYAALRKLLVQHADDLARTIDCDWSR